MISPINEESILKNNIIMLLDDPINNNSKYLNMSLDELNKELEKKTSLLNIITHEQYQKIYDLQDKKLKQNCNFVSLKHKILKQNKKIKEMNQIIKEQEDLLNQEEDEDDAEEKMDFSSVNKSPSLTYKSYNYSPKINSSGDKLIFNRSPVNSNLNGDLNEEEAIKLAIANSEKMSNDVIDIPFQEVQHEGSKSKSPYLEKIVIIRKPFENRYDHLENRPEEANDKILDDLYELLTSRNFDKIKEFLSDGEIPLKVVQWIRQLNYDGNSFKQLLVSKSNYIHKCLRTD